MAYNLDDLLSELEGAEKTASQHFSDSILGDKKTEKTASDAGAGDKKTEKTASTETDDAGKGTQSTEAEKIASQTLAPELVKIAKQMGEVASYSFFQQLAAMGVSMPTNRDMDVPPVSAVSRPSQSPVTMAGDAEIQEMVGHDGYDKLEGVKSKVAPDRQKTASLVTPEFLQEFKNTIKNQ